jgi:hypothetical protein
MHGYFGTLAHHCASRLSTEKKIRPVENFQKTNKKKKPTTKNRFFFFFFFFFFSLSFAAMSTDTVSAPAAHVPQSVFDEERARWARRDEETRVLVDRLQQNLTATLRSVVREKDGWARALEEARAERDAARRALEESKVRGAARLLNLILHYYHRF